MTATAQMFLELWLNESEKKELIQVYKTLARWKIEPVEAGFTDLDHSGELFLSVFICLVIIPQTLM